MRHPRPKPPRPDLIRRPAGGFGWLDDRLLRDGWLARIGPDAIAVLALLALAADRHGTSFYGRSRMAHALGMDRHALDHALARLMQSGLVDHRPWKPGQADGVWQVLPLPALRTQTSNDQGPVSIKTLLKNMGLAMPNGSAP